MAIVYIASPYKALVVRESQRKAQAISIAQQECLKIMRECEGFTPVSPILQFWLRNVAKPPFAIRSYAPLTHLRDTAWKKGLRIVKKGTKHAVLLKYGVVLWDYQINKFNLKGE